MDTVNASSKSTLGAIILFYLLIAFEFFYMASPFAVYFYGLYKPCLNFLDKFPSISWITGFFLPHLVEDTKSVILNSVKITGTIIAATGFITFLVCAFQVYYAKLFKKGMVNGGLYKYIRHPQYTAFAVCSFGMLLLWPRFLVLYMFISLIFAYYLLAKIEEKECEKKFGDSYLFYKNKTYMFLPFFSIPFPKRYKALSIATIYLLTMFAALQFGKQLKLASIQELYSKTEGNNTYVSIFQIEEGRLNKLITDINRNEDVKQMLKKQTFENDQLISYVVPNDMYISEIPMISPEIDSCHVFNYDYATDYKLVITKAQLSNTLFKEKQGVLYSTTHLLPLIEIWYEKGTDKISRIIELPASAVKYENIPEPIF